MAIAHSRLRPRGRSQQFAMAVALSAICVGCSKSGVERIPLSGQVTYKGQPVPAGSILFEPDGVKGNRGPQGYSSIINGYYETSKFGKGAVTGPVNVQIMGFVVGNQAGEGGNKPLFPAYKTSIIIERDSTEFNFDVPSQPQS